MLSFLPRLAKRIADSAFLDSVVADLECETGQQIVNKRSVLQ